MLALKGIRLANVTIKRNESGAHEIEHAKYELISAKDTVLATETLGKSYGASLEVPLSVETIHALAKFTEGYHNDIERVLGFTE